MQYSDLKTEFDGQMSSVGLNFADEYQKAEQAFVSYEFETPDKRFDAIRDVLQIVLFEYSQTKAEKKSGRIARVVAKVLSSILKIFKK